MRNRKGLIFGTWLVIALLNLIALSPGLFMEQVPRRSYYVGLLLGAVAGVIIVAVVRGVNSRT